MRPRRTALAGLLAAAAVGAALATPPVAAQEIASISIHPSAPTWRDRVTVVLTGTSACFYDPTARLDDFGRPTVDLAVLCPPGIPGSTFPFRIEATLPHLRPGVHDLRVLEGNRLLARREMEILDVAPGWILPPAAPLTDAEPVVLRIGGRALCPDFDTEAKLRVIRAADGVVEARFADYCRFTNDPPEPFSLPLDLGLLAAGEWEVRLSIGSPFDNVVRRTITVHPADRCLPDATTLCLGDGRFRVRATWQDFQGGSGDGRTVPFDGRDDTGAFWFFHPDNLELTVKVLDGCGVNGRHWVFLSPGSTAGWQVTVTDLEAPARPSRTYGNALGTLPALRADAAAFATCP